MSGGDFLDTITEASARYAPQAILLGRLFPLGSRQWQVRWTLQYQGEVYRWQQQSEDIQVLIAGGIGQTSEHLVQHFTRSFSAGSGSMLLEVEGIANLRQYRRVRDYLSAVHGVTRVQADRVTPTAVRFSMATEGGSEAVLQTIALGEVLEAATGSAMPSGDDAAASPLHGDRQDPEQSPPQPAVQHYRLVP